jgi:argininosuccinate lyase
MNQQSLGRLEADFIYRGRSRNDQVATDMRLWLRDQLREIETYIVEFLTVLANRAEQDIEYIMPGYTHLQRAQVTAETELAFELEY